jgi:hypothetical protein
MKYSTKETIQKKKTKQNKTKTKTSKRRKIRRNKKEMQQESLLAHPSDKEVT